MQATDNLSDERKNPNEGILSTCYSAAFPNELGLTAAVRVSRRPQDATLLQTEAALLSSLPHNGGVAELLGVSSSPDGNFALVTERSQQSLLDHCDGMPDVHNRLAMVTSVVKTIVLLVAAEKRACCEFRFENIGLINGEPILLSPRTNEVPLAIIVIVVVIVIVIVVVIVMFCYYSIVIVIVITVTIGATRT